MASKIKYELGNYFRLVRHKEANAVSKNTNVALRKVSEWMGGIIRPTRTNALIMFRSFNIRRSGMDNILNIWGYSPLKMSEYSRIRMFRDMEGEAVLSRNPSTSPLESARTNKAIRNQIDSLDSKFSSLSNRIETELKGAQTDSLQPFKDDLANVKQSLMQLQDTSQQLAAPVILPKPKDMQVTLVSSSSLHRLEEYRSQENRWYSVLTLFLGAILGILANLATGGTFTPTGIVLVLTFGLMGGFSFFSARGFQQQADEIRKSMTPNDPEDSLSTGDNHQDDEFASEIIEE